jgi:thiol-disulfide isomerase/thioredoxin
MIKKSLVAFFLLNAVYAYGQELDSAWVQKYIANFSTGIGDVVAPTPLFYSNGKAFDLNTFAGKTIYVNIWTTSCGSCYLGYPDEQKMVKQIAAMGLADSVVFINICTGFGGDPKKWKKDIGKRHDNIINLFSPDSSIFKNWNMEIQWPSFVLLNKAGRFLGKNVPRAGEAMTAFMLLAATKNIANFSTGIGDVVAPTPLFYSNGKAFDLNTFAGKTIYVNIWTTSCGSCYLGYPDEQKMVKQIAAMGLADSVVFINICTGFGGDPKKWKKDIGKRHDNIINLFSPDSSIFKNWNMEIQWPSFVLLNKAGRFLGKNVPRAGEAMTAFMLLAATKNIAAKDAIWTSFVNDALLTKGSKDIDSLYLGYLEKYFSDYYPYLAWKGRIF